MEFDRRWIRSGLLVGKQFTVNSLLTFVDSLTYCIHCFEHRKICFSGKLLQIWFQISHNGNKKCFAQQLNVLGWGHVTETLVKRSLKDKDGTDLIISGPMSILNIFPYHQPFHRWLRYSLRYMVTQTFQHVSCRIDGSLDCWLRSMKNESIAWKLCVVAGDCRHLKQGL